MYLITPSNAFNYGVEHIGKFVRKIKMDGEVPENYAKKDERIQEQLKQSLEMWS